MSKQLFEREGRGKFDKSLVSDKNATVMQNALQHTS